MTENNKYEATFAKMRTLETEMDGFAAAYNAALKDDNLKEMNAQEVLLKEHAKTYLGLARNLCFEQISDPENPVATYIRAIKALCFTTKSYKIDREDGQITECKIVDKACAIDLKRLATYNKFDKSWFNAIERFNILLTMRTAKELGLTDAQIKDINDSTEMRKLLAQVTGSKNPDSKTQLCKQLQALIDQIVFMEGEKDKTKNQYRCNSHDIAYLLMCYTKRGKSALKVVSANSAFVQRLVTEIMHRIITGKVYDLDYNLKK